MIIYLGADHAGFRLKEIIKKHLIDEGYEVEDMGASKYKEKDDYPDFIHPVAAAVSKNCQQDKGIILGGSGQGEAMVANRYHGVRAAVFYGGPAAIIKLSRQHNDANILALGARFLEGGEAVRAVDLWLKTFLSKEMRHRRRIAKIEK